MKITRWLVKDKNIVIENTKHGVLITNNNNFESKVFSPRIFKANKKVINVKFKADVINGSGAILTFINRKKERMFDVILNSITSTKYKMKGFFLPVIILKPMTTIEITKVEIDETIEPKCNYFKTLGKKDILLITPIYPSLDNLYACGFVHARVKEYIKAGLNVEIASINKSNVKSEYTIEGVTVYKSDYEDLRNILMSKHYKAILVHFLDEKYGEYLDTSYLNDTPVFLWNHGVDILYWDYKDIYTPYFEQDISLPKHIYREYKKRDMYVKKFAYNKNFNWIFVSNSEKNRAEEIHKIKFNNAVVIPNIINSDTFKFKEKNIDERKKIFMVRRFDNTKKYAIDLTVLTILELSRRPFFKELEFYICGEGCYYDELVEPLKKFNNVKLIHNFLTHDQIKEYHDKCGIALFPTRQDTQGVSALEAASSGLVVITSDLEVIREYFDENLNTICPVENVKVYADKIEYFYNNPDEFLKVSKAMNEHTYKKCNKKETIDKEIEYINKYMLKPEELIYPIKKISDEPLLTITIPAYNSGKYLEKCLLSLLKTKYSYLTEILIINDGSTDNTLEIGKKYEKLTTYKNKSIVKVIDKENGGHGSGINKGIELARGKYFKVVDSDDWLEPDVYNEFLSRLIKEDVDLILCDYSEARTFENKPYKKEFFNFMTENVEYNLNDICTGVYGFQDFGPSLPTATYKLECLRNTNFKLLENTFYVDMLYNAYSIININSVKKYNLNIYRYYIGNVGQSVSAIGMKKNYKHHEKVILELSNIVTYDKRLTSGKKEFITNRLLIPMINVQYYVHNELIKSGKEFLLFEKKIKKFPDIIKNTDFKRKNFKFHRLTRGMLFKYNNIITKISSLVHKVKNRLR